MSVTYCDSSFLLALYVEDDPFHFVARRTATTFSEAIPWTMLVETEVINGARRLLATEKINQATLNSILRQLVKDEETGILGRPVIDLSVQHAKAIELSRHYTSKMNCRSCDILHLSSAVALSAKTLASFDEKQRALAKAMGLAVVPIRR